MKFGLYKTGDPDVGVYAMFGAPKWGAAFAGTTRNRGSLTWAWREAIALGSQDGTIVVAHEPHRWRNDKDEVVQLLQQFIALGWATGAQPIVFYGRAHTFINARVRPDLIALAHIALYALNKGDAKEDDFSRPDAFDVLAVAERLSRQVRRSDKNVAEVWAHINFLADEPQEDIARALRFIRDEECEWLARILVRTCNKAGHSLDATAAAIAAVQEVSGG